MSVRTGTNALNKAGRQQLAVVQMRKTQVTVANLRMASCNCPFFP